MLLGKSSSKTVPPAMLSEFESGTVLSLSGTVLSLFGGTRGRGWWRSRGATGGEPLPPLASAASRRVGPCTRSVVQRSCTGGPGAASASVTPGRRADSERSGPSSEQPIPSLDFTASLCFDLAVRPFKLFHPLIQRHPGQRGALDAYREFAHALQGHQ